MNQYNHFYVITAEAQSEELKKALEYINTKYTLVVKIIECDGILHEDMDEESLYFAYLSDTKLKALFKNEHSKDIHFAVLPHKEASIFCKSYGISKKMEEAIDVGMDITLCTKVDMLVCNDEVVFHHVSMGNMHGFDFSDTFETDSLWGRIRKKLAYFQTMDYLKFTFTTAKDQIIDTVGMGVLIVEHTHNANESFSLKDGKLNAFILAPTSILSYLYYLLMIFFYRKLSILRLPKSLGFIQTSKLKVTSNAPLDFLLDNTASSAKSIELEVKRSVYFLHFKGENKEVQNVNNENAKDTVKISSMPSGEIAEMLLLGKTFFFKHAGEENFKDLFIALRCGSKLTTIYLMLMILSTLLATTGLFQNSTPVIIGAMILAPLMSPIIAFSMGIIRSDRLLVSESAKTLAWGIFVALSLSALYTCFMPLESLNEEIKSRLNPNILDLMVAIISGVAGAYANAKEEVAKSFAGVAIAVALVPPLSVAGIGIGWGNWDIIYGAFLLFSTNLVGITLASSVTFIVMGYAPLQRAKKNVAWAFIVLGLIAIPLVISFQTIVAQNSDLRKIAILKSVNVGDEAVTIVPIRIKSSSFKKTSLEIELISYRQLSHEQLQKVHKTIERCLNKNVTLEVVSKIRLQ